KTGLLDREDIDWALHDAQQAIVAPRVGALCAQLFLAEGAALPTVGDIFHRLGQCLGQAQTTTAITLEHLQGHALCGLLPDTGENTQRIDELTDQGAETHGDLDKKTGRTKPQAIRMSLLMLQQAFM